jgi:D-sedoheptulose 7-phosphate isomerase
MRVSDSAGTESDTDFAAHIAAHFAGHRAAVDAAEDSISAAVERAGDALVEALRAGRRVYCFGNGGSATQASHLAGELIGRFKLDRAPLPAIALSSDPATVTCIANDYGFAAVFERQIEALATVGDIAIGMTTSGKSENIIRGLRAARTHGAITIALTGAAGLVDGEPDHMIAVPSDETAYVQEIHLIVLHIWCRAIDKEFGKRPTTDDTDNC